MKPESMGDNILAMLRAFGTTFDEAAKALMAFGDVLQKLLPMRRELVADYRLCALWRISDGAFTYYSLECRYGAFCWLPGRFWGTHWWAKSRQCPMDARTTAPG